MQVERGAYGRLRGGFEYDEDDRRPELVGQLAYVTKVQEKDGEPHARISAEGGVMTWWPIDFIDPVPREEIGTMVDVGQIDVANADQLHDMAMKIVARMEMLGTPTRMSVFISDIRDPDNAAIVGGPVVREMAKGHYNRKEGGPADLLRHLLGHGQ